MKRIIKNIREIIGNTPMIKFNNDDYDIPKNVNIYGKIEYLNPGGSIKDRTVEYMINKAEKAGLIKPGYTIYEATAGNTGISLAMIAIQKGYKVAIAVPGKFSIEKQIVMRALGADVYNTRTEDGMEGAYKKIDELREHDKNSYVLNQFSNELNTEAHYNTTGPEIYEDLDGEVDVFIAGAGTGGTYSGIVKYLKEKNSSIEGVLADPVGSILGGGEYGSYRIEGIGNDFIPETFDASLVDKAIYVNDDDAYSMVKELAHKSGLTVGSSSGANFLACLKYAKSYKGDKEINIVTLLPDRSDRYFSKDIYGYKEMYEK